MTIQFRRGTKANLPVAADQGEPLWSTDTNEMFVGNGLGNALSQILGSAALDAYKNQLASNASGNSGADNIGATAISGLTGATTQALLQALKNKIDSVNPVAGFFNVKDPTYGAKGDGATNDTVAIQSAITSATTNGGIVYFPPGTYKHTGLTVPSNITLQGSGYLVTILDCTSTTANGITLDGSARQVSIFDMKLHSSGASTGWAISGTGGVVGEFTIDRYMITGFKNGIDIWQATNSTIGQGRLTGQGRTVAGGRGIKLGENSTNVSTTVTIGKAFLTNYEYLVHEVYCLSLLMVNTIMQTAKRGLVTSKYTILINPYWGAIDDYHIYADGDGVYVAGGYGLDPAKVFLDATYAANRSVISWGKTETRFYNKVVLGNGGTAIVKHLSVTASLDFASIAANTAAELNITVTGAAAGDTVSVTPNGAPEAGLVWSGLAGTDIVTVRLGNVTTAAIDPVARTWRVDVWKH